MGLFEHFPYTNFHELNLEWLLKEMAKNSQMVKEFAEQLVGINNTLEQLQGQIDLWNSKLPEVLAEAKRYTDTQILALKQDISASGGTIFWDVFRHTYRPGQVLFDDYYNFLRDHEYTCRWWDDGNGIAWKDYDALAHTPLEWDLNGEVYVRDATDNWPWVGSENDNTSLEV